MPQLIKKIVGEVYNTVEGDVILINSVVGEVQEEDYVNLNGFTAYLQNLTRAEVTVKLQKPLNFGLVNGFNGFNTPIVTIEINY